MNRDKNIYSILILGATSIIARAVANEFATNGYNLLLAGRNQTELDILAADLELHHGIQTKVYIFDALAFDSHETVLDSCFSDAGETLRGVIACFGYLGEQNRAQADFAEARRIIDTNFTACVSLLNICANHFEKKRMGFICAISSVAGDRGRQSNYLYGAAKGGLSIYLQGLRNRLFTANVRVITVKPGFVNTPMTYGKPGFFLVASPTAVARTVYKAIMRKRDVVYAPWFWSWIMLIIRNIPERLFKRLGF